MPPGCLSGVGGNVKKREEGEEDEEGETST